MNRSFRHMVTLIREDYQANGRDWSKPGFRTLMVYRFGVWRMAVRSKWLRAPLSLVYRIGYRHCRNVYGIELPYTAQLGRAIIIEHQGGIVIHGNSIIGDACILRQNCTLGLRSLDRLDEAPILGARVNVGAGAVILGRVMIGNDVSIGANAVVLNDVPDGKIAVGIPARLI